MASDIEILIGPEHLHRTSFSANVEKLSHFLLVAYGEAGVTCHRT